MRRRPARTWRRRLLLAGLTLLMFLLPCAAQDNPTSLVIPPVFARFTVARDSTASQAALNSALDEVARQEDRPEQIVVLIHGYDMDAEQSSRLFEPMAQTVKSELYPTPVAVVAVQWDSGGGGFDYFSTLARARQVGRGPLRQLLLTLHQRYPQAALSVMAHSMGCEITVAALVPEIAFKDNPPEGEAFQPERELRLAVAAFAGSDLDFDMWTRYPQAARLWFDRVRLTWSTLTDPSGPGDKVLSLRARIRGKAAGVLMPPIPQAVLDRIIPAGGLFLDTLDVPSDHELDSYYSPSRLKRIIAALKFVAVPGSPEPEDLAAMREVVETPDDLPTLLSYLDQPNGGAAYAALWRVERLNCGDSRHLADGTLSRAAGLLADSPQQVWRDQVNSPCVTMRKGQFPTDKMMTRAGAPPWARPKRFQPRND